MHVIFHCFLSVIQNQDESTEADHELNNSYLEDAVA